MVPVREGRKLWCHSSRLATRAVIASAILPHTMDQRGLFFTATLARQARKSRMLRTAYPITWPVFRIRKCQVRNRTGSKPKRKWRNGYKIRPVFSEESEAVDSIAIIPNQMMAGIQAFQTLGL